MVLRATDKTGILAQLEKFLRRELMREWIAQGHYMNGKVVREMDFVVETRLNSLQIDLMMYPYAGYIETGTPAEKIPYSGRRGRGGTSQYIQALIGYVQKRMNIADLAEAKSIAFAIAETQRKKGMPTPGSYKHSSTGKRTEWIQETINREETDIQRFLFRYIDIIFETQLNNIITKYQRKFKEK